MTESQVTVNGQSGKMVKWTAFEGSAKFISALEAAGVAEWHAKCDSSNPEIIICSAAKRTGLAANGNVPFQITFNR